MKLHSLGHKLLKILCWDCRCASVVQLARAAGVSAAIASEAVRGLRARRLAAEKTLCVATVPVAKPLSVWRPGMAVTDFGNLAWVLESRWRNAERGPARIVWATGRGPRIVGGVAGSLRQPLQLEHDLAVAEVFVRHEPDDGTKWLGEDTYRMLLRPRVNGKVPDAVLVDRHRRVAKVIELGGRYSHHRLAMFHRYWSSRQTPYEIW